MKFLTLIIIVLSLSGCALFQKPVPIVPKFPDSVPELMKKCEELKTLEGDKVAITELLKTVVQNYTLYYECSNKVEGWQEWYNMQRKVFDNLKP